MRSMRRPLTVLILLLATFAAAATTEVDYSGDWTTTYGELRLTQKKRQVDGLLISEGVPCPFSGKVAGRNLDFTLSTTSGEEKGRFELAAGGRAFHGESKEEDGTVSTWEGEIAGGATDEVTFDGVWNTNCGMMRLFQGTSENMVGVYAVSDGSLGALDGTVRGRRFEFAFEEDEAKGTGRFERSTDGVSFTGTWRLEGETEDHPWTGLRVEPVPGRTWLVVLEARWERSLDESEYSVGRMLAAWFSRVPSVEVRHRFFDGSASLKRWLSEVAFLPGPALVVIASHGEREGLTVGKETIGPEVVAEGLAFAHNVGLLHFSSCLFLRGDFPKRLRAAMKDGPDVPISGYVTSVDWGQSALCEFQYFNLILAEGYSPEEAADALPELMPLSGDDPIEGVNLAPLGFRYLPEGSDEVELPPGAAEEDGKGAAGGFGGGFWDLLK